MAKRLSEELEDIILEICDKASIYPRKPPMNFRESKELHRRIKDLERELEQLRMEKD